MLSLFHTRYTDSSSTLLQVKLLRTLLLKFSLKLKKRSTKFEFFGLTFKHVNYIFSTCWIFSYLRHKKSLIRVTYKTSMNNFAKFGLPQGRKISVELFTFLLNYMHSYLQINLSKYTDDTCVFSVN